MEKQKMASIYEGTKATVIEYARLLLRWKMETIYCFDYSLKNKSKPYILWGDKDEFLELCSSTKFSDEESQLKKLLKSIEILTINLDIADETIKEFKEENDRLLGIDDYDEEY